MQLYPWYTLTKVSTTSKVVIFGKLGCCHNWLNLSIIKTIHVHITIYMFYSYCDQQSLSFCFEQYQFRLQNFGKVYISED